MNDISSDKGSALRRVYGPTVHYADGHTVAGRALDVEAIIAAFEQSLAESQRAFLSVFAHDLTVAVRALLFDRPVSDADLEKVKEINEVLHQLTSCVNPHGHWSAHDEALLLRAIIDASFGQGLDRWVGHAFALAAGALPKTKSHATAK